MTTIKEVREKINADSTSLRNGIFTVRFGFFYTHGRTAEHAVARVKAAFPNAIIIDSGEKWTAFRGGASIANSSHWWVKFRTEPGPISD